MKDKNNNFFKDNYIKSETEKLLEKYSFENITVIFKKELNDEIKTIKAEKKINNKYIFITIVFKTKLYISKYYAHAIIKITNVYYKTIKKIIIKEIEEDNYIFLDTLMSEKLEKKLKEIF